MTLVSPSMAPMMSFRSIGRMVGLGGVGGGGGAIAWGLLPAVSWFRCGYTPCAGLLSNCCGGTTPLKPLLPNQLLIPNLPVFR